MRHGYRDTVAAVLDAREAAVRAARASASAAALELGQLQGRRSDELAPAAADAANLAERELRRAHRELGFYRMARPVLATKRKVRDHKGRTREVVVPSHLRSRVRKLRHDPAGMTPSILSSTTQQSVKRCVPTTVLAECGCGSGLISRGCGSTDCVDCADAVAARRSKRTRARLESALRGDQRVLRVILTIPPELRERFVDPAAWRELGRRAFKMLSSVARLRFAVEATHPVGDGDHHQAGGAEVDGAPCHEFHPHFNFIGVQLAGSMEFVAWDKLRAAWARVLGLPPARTPQVHGEWFRPRAVEFSRGAESVAEAAVADWRHAARYTVRPFPGWSAWAPPVRWFGEYPTGVEAPSYCPTCGVEVACCGVGATALRRYSSILEARGLDPWACGIPDWGPVRFGAGVGP